MDSGLDILLRLFRPAVRFCIRRSISFSSAVESLKAIFVECAVSELSKQGERAAISRVSVMSGVTRREVQRILATNFTAEQPLSIVTRVLNRWEQDDRFRARDKQPRALSFQGEESEFRALVAAVTKDVSAGTVLAEMQRVGAVELTARGLKPRGTVYDQSHSEDRVISFLIRNLETLVKAAEENAYNPGATKNLHTRTEYDNIAKDALPEIRRWIMEKGMALHKEAREYLSQFDLDINQRDAVMGGGRVSLCAFSLTDPIAESEQEEVRKKASG